MVKPIAKLAQHTRHGIWFWVLFVLGGVGLWALPALGANYVVNTTADNTTDDAFCTLREAILAANNAPANTNCGLGSSADDTITFSVSGTIVLGSQLPAIVSGQGKLTIDGVGRSIIISGNNSVRVFYVNSGGDLTLQNLTVSNGRADFGGGIGIANGGTVNITNSTLSSNSATVGGGGIRNSGTVTITNSTLSGNSADLGVGGGIYNDHGTVNITNSTLSGNSAIPGFGGGIYNYFGMLTITNSTLSGNSAGMGLGGGIFSEGGTANIKNTIVANSPSGGNCASNGTFNALGVNLDTDGTCPGFVSPFVSSAQLNLGPLAVNAPGTTATHALLSSSVAIDAATDCTDLGGNSITTDQRGVGRSQGPECDVGAYEAVVVTLFITGTSSGSGTVTATGINCTISAGSPSGDCTESALPGSNPTLTFTATPEAGSTFAGWSGHSDCTDGSVTINTNKICTATFNLVQQHTLTVTLAGTGSGTVTSSPTGINCPGDCTEDYNHGTVVTLTATSNVGSGFAGWTNCDSPSGNQCTMTMNAGKTVTATFSLSQFTLSVTKAGSGSGTVTSNPAGIDCGADCSEIYPFNTVVTLTATPSGGSTFAGWSGDADCSDGSVTMNADKSCTATFNLVPYTLGDVNDDGKINTLDARMAQQHADGVITLTGNQFLAADVDTDSDVDSADATAIAKKGIGLPTGIPGFAQLPPSPQPSPWKGEGLLLVLLPMLFLLLLRRSRKIATLLLALGLMSTLSGCVGFLGIAPPSGPAVYLTSVAMPDGATRFIELRVQELTAQGGLASLQGRITFPSGV
ncbi:CSLREA domain-containing protein, partial [Candidatus Acetothermia bacterium]|nr:CSLREA domain-containing protein [Candidatus Acetothermia bacterium]MCI2436174.1 CSLREA domain-containing protein [Candidatus Acetothermia bacterium]